MILGVGVCNYQTHVHTEFFRSFGQINQPCQVKVFFGDHPWDVIRNNRIINEFIQSDCTHFAKMDTDQAYPKDYFEKMLPLMKDHDVIGPMIYDRGITTGFMPLCQKEDSDTPFYPPSTAHDGRTGIEQVPYLHTNCFYNRNVLEALEKPWYEAHMTPDGLNRANHVDHTFMKKIAAKGFKIFVNNDVVAEHITQFPISRKIHEHWNRKS